MPDFVSPRRLQCLHSGRLLSSFGQPRVWRSWRSRTEDSQNGLSKDLTAAFLQVRERIKVSNYFAFRGGACCSLHRKSASCRLHRGCGSNFCQTGLSRSNSLPEGANWPAPMEWSGFDDGLTLAVVAVETRHGYRMRSHQFLPRQPTQHNSGHHIVVEHIGVEKNPEAGKLGLGELLDGDARRVGDAAPESCPDP